MHVARFFDRGEEQDVRHKLWEIDVEKPRRRPSNKDEVML